VSTQQTLDGRRERGAALSDCGRYRYLLFDYWDADAPIVLWVMLNPSTADAEVDDPTIRRCRGFTRAWGAGGFEVVNLYAWRATDPRELGRTFHDPVGRWSRRAHNENENDRAIVAAARRADRVIAAWGAWCGPHPNRPARVLDLLAGQGRQVEALGLTKDGHPRHPLYVRGDVEPIVYREAARPVRGAA
jgi:hypothetical protein